MIRIAFDVDDVGLLTLRKVALGIHDDAAGNRAVCAGVASFRETGQLVGAYRCRVSLFNVPETERTDCGGRKTRAGAFHKSTPRELHIHLKVLLRDLAPNGGRLAGVHRRAATNPEKAAQEAV